MQGSRLSLLFQRYFEKTATPREKEEFIHLLHEPGHEEEIEQLIADAWNTLQPRGDTFSADQGKKMLLNILHEESPPARTFFSSYKTLFTSYRGIAASLIFLLLGTGIFFLMGRRAQNPLAKTEGPHVQRPADVLPGGDKAVLTLADGSTIVLDSSRNGTITTQGNVKIVKLKSGLLTYNTGNTATSQPLYNMISTPVGGQYQVELPDGSKVWLNAASSLKFPTAFSGKERLVEVTGEAYFEVKKDPTMPFRVGLRDVSVEVLGTSFDIMAYNEEASITTVLVEGSVNIGRGDEKSLLKPGQQAGLDKTTGRIRVDQADVEEAIAWKNGLFQFDGASLETIMRQLSRWYGVEVTYEGNIPKRRLRGKAPRNTSLAELLKILELSGMHFKLTEKKIIVSAPV